MPDSDDTHADASAEKAYAQASEKAGDAKPDSQDALKAEPVTSPDATALEIPSVKPKVETKPMAEKAKTASKPKAAPAPEKVAATKPKVASKPKVAPKAAPQPKPKVAASPKIAAKKKPAKPVGRATPFSKTKTATTISANATNKDEKMTISNKVTSGLESMMSDAQAKAKDAFEKSSAMFGDYADFAKGNIEAVVQSGKILAEGLQDMGSNLVAESRSAFESTSADIKGMAAAKSPTDLIQLQSEMVRKNFDTAVAYGSKNTEAMIKLLSEVMSPISSRVSIAVEKVRQPAI